MRNRATSIKLLNSMLLAVVVASGSVPCPAAQTPGQGSQPKPQTKPKPAEVSLGDVSGRPGESVFVSVYSSPGDGSKLRSVELSVVYPSATLKFDKVNKSSEDKWKNVDVSVEDFTTTGEGRREFSTLVVKAAMLPSAPSDALAEGIPQGVFGKLAFHIDEDADGDILDLNLSGDAIAVGENSPLPEDAVLFEGGLVYVLAPGNFPGCFFFTH